MITIIRQGILITWSQVDDSNAHVLITVTAVIILDKCGTSFFGIDTRDCILDLLTEHRLFLVKTNFTSSHL